MSGEPVQEVRGLAAHLSTLATYADELVVLMACVRLLGTRRRLGELLDLVGCPLGRGRRPPSEAEDD